MTDAVPRVWLDTDVALGSTRGDVDDGFAIAAHTAFTDARSGKPDAISTSAPAFS